MCSSIDDMNPKINTKKSFTCNLKTQDSTDSCNEIIVHYNDVHRKR